MVLGHLGTHMQENDVDPYLTPHTTQTLLHKLKLKPLGKNRDVNNHDLGLDSDLLGHQKHKPTHTKLYQPSRAFHNKLRTFVLQRTEASKKTIC